MTDGGLDPTEGGLDSTTGAPLDVSGLGDESGEESGASQDQHPSPQEDNAFTTGHNYVNTAPLAVNDVYLVRQDEARTVDASEGVLSNDFPPDGSSLTAAVLEDFLTSSGATVSLSSDGSFIYIPAASWWGEDAFEYTATDENGAEVIGKVRIVVRPTAAPLTSTAAGIGGFSLDGQAADDATGRSVSGAGDFNGDGFSDIIIGAHRTRTHQSLAGRAYVIFGRSDGLVPSWPGLNDGIGLMIDGQAFEAHVGFSVSDAGDFDGDGLSDIVFGADDAYPRGNSLGNAYVIFGRSDGLVPSLSSLEAGVGFVLAGETTGQTGSAVTGAGDFNGDGLSDIIVGAPFADQSSSDSGRAYIIFGRSDGLVPSLSSIVIHDENDGDQNRSQDSHENGGFFLDGQASRDRFGHAMSSAGDFNQDGLADIMLGAPHANSDAGRTYVIFGRTDRVIPSLSDVVAGRGGFALDGQVAGDQAGYAMSGAGDFNGDGLSDIVVGAPHANSDSGRAYVIFGRSDTSPPDLSEIAEGRGGFALDGESAGDLAGYAVSGAGDLNGDGLSDIVIGAPYADTHGVDAGRIYVVFGRSDRAAPSLSNVADGIGGFVLDGQASSDCAGRSVSGAGDFNGDGFSDIILGATCSPPSGSEASDSSHFGRIYVVFGGDFTLSASFHGRTSGPGIVKHMRAAPGLFTHTPFSRRLHAAE